MKIKQFFILGAMVLMLGVFLAGCGKSSAPAADSSTSESTTAEETTADEQTLTAVINRKGDFLVLLTDAGEYQVMDLEEGVSLDDFTEGDSVTVTYTGELGNEETPPVISAIEAAG